MLYCITKTQRSVAWFKRGSADEEKANKKLVQYVFVSKAPLCKGSCRANARLRDCEMLRREQKEEREVSNNPSVIFLRKCHLLVATRSRSGENNAPCCFLIPSRRYATSLSTREAYGETRLRVASNRCMASRPIHDAPRRRQ